MSEDCSCLNDGAVASIFSSASVSPPPTTTTTVNTQWKLPFALSSARSHTETQEQLKFKHIQSLTAESDLRTCDFSSSRSVSCSSSSFSSSSSSSLPLSFSSSSRIVCSQLLSSSTISQFSILVLLFFLTLLSSPASVVANIGGITTYTDPACNNKDKQMQPAIGVCTPSWNADEWLIMYCSADGNYANLWFYSDSNCAFNTITESGGTGDCLGTKFKFDCSPTTSPVPPPLPTVDSNMIVKTTCMDLNCTQSCGVTTRAPSKCYAADDISLIPVKAAEEYCVTGGKVVTMGYSDATCASDTVVLAGEQPSSDYCFNMVKIDCPQTYSTPTLPAVTLNVWSDLACTQTIKNTLLYNNQQCISEGGSTYVQVSCGRHSVSYSVYSDSACTTLLNTITGSPGQCLGTSKLTITCNGAERIMNGEYGIIQLILGILTLFVATRTL